MAQVTNGTVKSNTMWYSTFYCSWKRSSYSVANNQSTVDWEAGLITTNGVYWGSNAVKINELKINSSKVLGNKTYSNIKTNGTHKLASGTVVIDHNSDGTKTFDISISGWLYDTGSPTGKGTFELVPIPRASKIIAHDVDIGKVMKIQIERPVDTFTHQIFVEFGNYTGIIGSNIETEMNWIVPANLYGEVQHSNSGKGKLRCSTYNGDTYIGESEAEFTAYVTNANPVAGDFTYKDTNDLTFAITQDRQRIIRGNSNLVFTIGTASPQKSATITKYELTFNGATRELTSAGSVDLGTVNLSSNTKATLKVTDSRGNTASKELEVIIDDWKLPTGIISYGRKNNFYTETLIKVDASYSSLNGKNALGIQYACRKDGEKNDSITGNLQDNVEATIELDNNYKWYITVFLTDRIGQTRYNLFVDRGMPIIFFDRLNENVGINCFPDGHYKLDIDGAIRGTTLPVATGLNNITSFDDVGAGGQLFKSGLYSVCVDNIWYNLLNIRHRNGITDGTLYGVQIRNRFTLGYDLEWRKQNNGTWTEWKKILSEDNMYPIGSVITTGYDKTNSKRITPEDMGYSGTWELIDKEFTPADIGDVMQMNSTNTSASRAYGKRSGHTITFNGNFSNKVALNDTEYELGTLMLSSMGVTGLPDDHRFVGFSDGGNSEVFLTLKSSNSLVSVDVGGNISSIASGKTWFWSLTLTWSNISQMLDSACNKFYWQRTS